MISLALKLSALAVIFIILGTYVVTITEKLRDKNDRNIR